MQRGRPRANFVTVRGRRPPDNPGMNPDNARSDAARRLLNQSDATCLVLEADYAPDDAADAAPWARRLLGSRCQWLGRWRIEAGPHAGQWAMVPVYRRTGSGSARPGEHWVPLAHLRQIRVLDRAPVLRTGPVLRAPRVS